jgi:2-(3-amino-3-carboxypropyl)histidine synthase
MESKYDLELDKVAKQITSSQAKKVLIQLPDGLKPKATEIADELAKQTGSEIMIWFGSCYGACDIPQVSEKDIDLIVQFGHSAWNKKI